MIRLSPLPLTLVLAACVTAAPPEPMGSVRVNNEDYPVEVLANGTWRVRVDGKPVICARPTAESCAWSARHHLTAGILLDDLG